jgi:hypothetical protein
MTRATDPARPLRKLLILVTAFAAPALGQLHAMSGWGRSVAEFAGEGDEVLRAGSWAFAIWGPIYLYLWIYAVAQALRRDEEPILRRVGWPSLVALAGIGLWTVVAQFGPDLLTVPIILASLLGALAPLLAAGPDQDGADLRTRATLVWPLAALAGWLTVATALNVITLAAKYGLLAGAPAEAWGMAGVAMVALTALLVILRTRLWIYGLPVAWGLVAVWAAERVRHPETGWAALVACALVALAAALRARR